MKKLKWIKTFEFQSQSIGISALYDTGASGAFGRWKNENPALELEDNVKSIVLENVEDVNLFNKFKSNRYSLEDNIEHIKQFYGKDGNLYIIRKDFDKDKFEVFDSTMETKKAIGVAFFDNTHPEYFSGYTFNDSIKVDETYRRKGISTAIHDFAELFYNKKYQPTNVLSDEMEGFVKNRLKK